MAVGHRLILPSSVRDLHVRPTPDGGEVRFEGLLTAERHKPLGNVGVYATPAAMQVAPLPLEEFVADLATIPLGMMLSVVNGVGCGQQPDVCDMERVVPRLFETASDLW